MKFGGRERIGKSFGKARCFLRLNAKMVQTRGFNCSNNWPDEQRIDSGVQRESRNCSLNFLQVVTRIQTLLREV